MATGTGKTRTAIALADLLQRNNWVKRTLFLADRISLVRQAANAFKTHLPECNTVNLVTEKNTEGRVYVCTYPSMMGLINETDNGIARFGSGYFDLIIIDEAHCSVYQKYKHIFAYFDSLLLGLTATPRDHIDRNTYGLFDLENGVPTDAYELETAVNDGYLVPPKAKLIDLRYPSQSIVYDDLSDEEKEEWESKEWGDRGEEGGAPKKVNAAAINQWLFNTGTVDAALKELMEHGHKVEGGDRLAKTIIFARNHKHAVFIQKRFDEHYPHYAGHFARIIDNQVKYAQSLIDEFSIKDKEPHIAISVDMLDTGIDVPEVANLAFIKPVYSRIKFWQMVGRGTRLCPDLFDCGKDKEDFRVFDFCGNFKFFKENPTGIEGGGGMSLGQLLFTERVRLLSLVDLQVHEDAGNAEVRAAVAKHLLNQVQAMPKKNFLVRMQLEAVEQFENAAAWESIKEEDVAILNLKVAGLPDSLPIEKLEAKRFDLICLKMQLATLEKNFGLFENLRKKVIGIAEVLEGKPTIPAIKAQLAFIQMIQQVEFWEGITLEQIEEIRRKLRDLAQFVEKTSSHSVYTNLDDEIMSVEEVSPINAPTMTSSQYEKKVREYLKSNQDQLAIHKLRMNEPLTGQDLAALEEILISLGADHGHELLNGMLEKNDLPSLPYLVRRFVGMDRKAALELFSKYLEDHSLSSTQQRFIELVVELLTTSGIVEKSALYEPPFADLHDGGPEVLFAGKENVIEGVFEVLDRTKENI